MKVYYVDYENVNHWGLEGIEKLSRSSKVYIVCRDTDTLRFMDINPLLETKANIEILTVSTGGRDAPSFQLKDALGFQLITHLMLKYNKNNEYFIIAKDKVYDFAIEMAKRLGKDNIKRFPLTQDVFAPGVEDDVNVPDDIEINEFAYIGRIY